VNGPVVINTGLSATNTVDSPTGIGTITRTATISATDGTGITAIGNIINNPAGMYVNLHTAASPGGVIRSQLLRTINHVAQIVGGGEWMTSIRVLNSSTTSVLGILNSYQTNGSPLPADVSDPNISFAIPPLGSATFTLHNKGTLTGGFAKVFTNGNVILDAGYSHPGYPNSVHVVSVTSRSVSIPVRVGSTPTQNTGIAVLAGSAGNVVLTLRDDVGVAIAGGSRSIAVAPNQQVVGFVRDLLPTVTQTRFSGTLTVEMQAIGGSGQLGALAIQFNGTLATVTTTAVP
jgi:hypothetical protein